MCVYLRQFVWVAVSLRVVAARTYECEDTLYAPVRLHTRAHARLSPPLPRRSRRCAGTVGRPCFTTRPWQARPSSSARSVPSKASALPTALVSWWEGRGCTPELLVFSCCRSCPPPPFFFPCLPRCFLSFPFPFRVTALLSFYLPRYTTPSPVS